MAMDKTLKFLIVDDDNFTSGIHKELLLESGYEAQIINSSVTALDEIQASKIKPDVILCDMLMPELDGLDFFHQLRLIKNIKQPIFIIITGKVFDYDKRQALAKGVDGYLLKPVNQDTFVMDLAAIVERSMSVQFWGVRGTLPVPGDQTVRYGGNTNCITLTCGQQFFIFDAGSGIKALSNYLIKNSQQPLNAKIFISHPHYDHINGFPFFVPLYVKGNEFKIYGSSHGSTSIEKLLSNQMDSIYFPITMNEFSATLTFQDISEETFMLDDVKIETLFLNHPGKCLGYAVSYQNKLFCYITDNELYLENSPHFVQHEVDRLIKFIKGADLLVIDSTYTDEEYPQKIGWGHSCISRVVDVADKAEVKVLCLFHHDPNQMDDDIDNKLKVAQQLLEEKKSSTKCIAAREGEKRIL